MVKAVAGFIGFSLSLPHWLLYVTCKPLLGEQRAFTAASERMAKIPGSCGVYARQAFYRRALAGVGRDVYFGFMSLWSKPAATVGDRVYIGRFCTIGLAHLGADVMLADGVQVLSGRHQHGRDAADGQTLRDNEQRFTPVTIGRGAWIGANAVVMADVGRDAIVGAGAVVVAPIPDGATVGGVPARPLRPKEA